MYKVITTTTNTSLRMFMEVCQLGEKNVYFTFIFRKLLDTYKKANKNYKQLRSYTVYISKYFYCSITRGNTKMI